MKKITVLLIVAFLANLSVFSQAQVPIGSMVEYGVKVMTPTVQQAGVTGAPIIQAAIEPVVTEMLAGYVNPDNTIDFQKLANELKDLTPTQIRTNIRDNVLASVASISGISDGAVLVDTMLTDDALTSLRDTLVTKANEYLKVNQENVNVTAGNIINEAIDDGETHYQVIIENAFTKLRESYSVAEVSDEVLGDTIKVAIGALTMDSDQKEGLLNAANE